MAIVIPGIDKGVFGGAPGQITQAAKDFGVMLQKRKHKEQMELLSTVLQGSAQGGQVDPQALIGSIFSSPDLTAQTKMQGLQFASALPSQKQTELGQLNQLIDARDSLPANDPKRQAIDAFIQKKTGQQQGQKSLSGVGKLLKERESLPQDSPLRKIYNQALSKQITPRGERIRVNSDGSVSIERGQGVTSGGGSFQRSTKGGLEKDILTKGAGISRLDQIQKSFNPDFLTLQGKFGSEVANLKEKVGFKLDPSERKTLKEFAVFRRRAFSNLNAYIKDITGAAMSEAEARRIRKGVPDPQKDGPTVFQTKLNDTIKELKLAQARLSYVRGQGLSRNSIDISQMPRIMNERGGELFKQFTSQGMNEEEAKRQVQSQLSQEFGLVE